MQEITRSSQHFKISNVRIIDRNSKLVLAESNLLFREKRAILFQLDLNSFENRANRFSVVLEDLSLPINFFVSSFRKSKHLLCWKVLNLDVLLNMRFEQLAPVGKGTIIWDAWTSKKIAQHFNLTPHAIGDERWWFFTINLFSATSLNGSPHANGHRYEANKLRNRLEPSIPVAVHFNRKIFVESPWTYVTNVSLLFLRWTFSAICSINFASSLGYVRLLEIVKFRVKYLCKKSAL